jgi:predicted CopG family antitoxin
MSDKTTIQVSTEIWKELNKKRLPGESFDDVIEKVLEAQ